MRVYGLFVTEPRQTQLDRLQELFTDASRGGRVTAVALHGAGGLGKTQIAARWWEDNQDSYDRRLWLDMRTDPDLVLARIATDLGLQGMDPVAEIVHYLSTTTERWLVVLDNAETAKAVEPYLPIEGTCDVVITSRYVDGWDTLNVAPIPVDVFDLESAVGLLSTVAGLDADDECAAVAERMGRVPLALTLAAHYIRESKWTFGSYFAYCDKHDFPLLNPADRAGYDRAIEAIWEESLATATERQADAEVVFRLISLLDWNDVDRAWFIQAAEYVIGVASLEAENTLATLHSYGLVDLTGDAVSIIHGLLAEGVTVATEENKVQLASFCNLVLDTEPEFRHVRELVMAHGRLVPREAVGILNRHAGHQLRSRLPDIRFHSELANISRRVLDFDHPTALVTRNNLASSYQAAGRTDEAVELREQALADCEHILGTDHADSLTSRNNLASSYQAAGRTDEAIRLKEQVLADRLRILGTEHPNTLASRNNLVLSYQAAGRIDEAIELGEQVLADSERILGTEHPNTLTSRNNLASPYQSAGRIDEAIELGERALADSERIHGTEHPNTLTSRNNLASLYQSAGRIEKAIELGEQALADRLRILGTEHPDTLTARNNLASSYQSAGRTDEAIRLKEEVLADSERILGTEHPNTLTSRNNLASSYEAAGRTDEAIELGEQVLADRERILGTEHPNTLASRHNLASSCQVAGRIDEAIALGERALADCERILGTDHPTTRASRNNLASSYESAGRIDEAIELKEQVLADRERILGTEHPTTAIARCHLAELRYRRNLNQ
ncbi:MAG: tetratricopeptide repeat protein [Actinobacteria bacterium]|nr:tetratricopeptide repeat protein [Actinomycetota bacterium]